MDLEALRRELAEVDRQILDCWARRDAITTSIGRTKQATGVPIHNPDQEREVLERARKHAEKRGLSPEIAVEILRLLMQSSLGRQETLRVRSEWLGDDRPALVIGGGGRMGRWFCRFLTAQGYRVTVADPAAGPPGIPRVDNWRQTRDEFALTVIAAPLGASGPILEEIAASGRKGLVFDIGSVKAPLSQGHEALRRSACHAASVHPMFGPDALVLHGCHVLVMDLGSKEAADDAARVFGGTMAEVLRLPLADHDPLIAYVLGLSHALNLAFLRALAESGEQAPTLDRISSVTFNRQLQVAAAVARENPRLYYEIQHANPHGDRALAVLLEAVTKVREAAAGDEPAFVRIMQNGLEYLKRRPA